MKRSLAAPGILVLVLVSGCFYEIRDELTECQINCANRRAARAAWENSQGACMGMSCPYSFKDGFMTGYKDIANGGTGCPPAVPVLGMFNCMWRDQCSDSAKMEAWYDGYEIGVIAARGDGMDSANKITTRMPRSIPIESPSEAYPQGSKSTPSPLQNLPVPAIPSSNSTPTLNPQPLNFDDRQTNTLPEIN